MTNEFGFKSIDFSKLSLSPPKMPTAAVPLTLMISFEDDFGHGFNLPPLSELEVDGSESHTDIHNKIREFLESLSEQEEYESFGKIFEEDDDNDWYIDEWVSSQEGGKFHPFSDEDGALADCLNLEPSRRGDRRVYLQAYIRSLNENRETTHESDARRDGIQRELTEDRTGAVKINFFVEAQEHQDSWKEKCGTISLNASPTDLKTLVETKITEACHENSDFLQMLRKTEQDFHIMPQLHFEDSLGGNNANEKEQMEQKNDKQEKIMKYRNDYFGWGQAGQCRIRKLRDLFVASQEDPIIPVKVLLKVRPAKERGQFMANDVHQPEYKYHRYGTLPLQSPDKTETEETQHSPMLYALLARYKPSEPDNWQPYQVAFREVNGVLLGSCQAGTLLKSARPVGSELMSYYELKSNPKAYNPTKEVIKDNVRLEARDEEITVDVPKEPAMTFSRHKIPKNPVQDLDGKHIHLAVRTVSHLHKPDGGDIEMPLNVLIRVTDGAQLFNAIQDSLRKRLIQFSEKEDEQATLSKILKAKDKWRMDLWVMPQGHWMRKLYFWRKEETNLRHFLDPEIVANGDTRLYIEAHLVPV